MYLIGIGIMLVGICLGMILKHVPLFALMNSTAITLHLTTILGVLTATGSFGVLVSGFKALILPNSNVPEEVRGRAASLFRLLSKTCAFAMLIGVLLGVVGIFQDLTDIEAMGAGMAAALISPLIGLLLIVIIFEPAVFILKKRPQQRSGKGQ